MRKYLIDFAVALIVGAIFFLGGSFLSDILYGGGGLIGYDTVSRYFPNVGHNFYALGLLYVFFGVVPFLLYILTPWFQKSHPHHGLNHLFFSFLFFSIGIYLSYLSFLVFAGIAFSLTTGPG